MPCDLHLEHMNRRLNKVIRNLGSNVKPTRIAQAVKAIGRVDNICKSFTESLGLSMTRCCIQLLHLTKILR